MISEEHLIRSHLNIYKLVKITEGKKKAQRFSYKMEDLINFI